MSFNLLTVEHKLAAVASKAVSVAKSIGSVLSKVQGSEKVVEALTAEIAPDAVAYERGAYTALGLLTKAANDVAVTAGSQTAVLNITADVQTINDFKALFTSLKNLAPAHGVTI